MVGPEVPWQLPLQASLNLLMISQVRYALQYNIAPRPSDDILRPREVIYEWDGPPATLGSIMLKSLCLSSTDVSPPFINDAN